jgi:hypothetical protein
MHRRAFLVKDAREADLDREYRIGKARTEWPK